MHGKQTLYDILDLPRDSDATAIALAHKRVRSEMERESSAPDPRRSALVHEAYEVLSDPQRRAAYDASLRSDHFMSLPQRAAARPRWAVGIAAGIVAALAAAYFTLHRPPSPGGARSTEEILSTASFSVGIVHSIDVTGRNVPAGLAVAIAEGVMVTTCHGLPAGAQLVVRLVGRSAPARVAMADEASDLCKLAVDGAGSRPLPLTREAPRVGDKVSTVSFTGEGLVTRAGTVKALVPTPRGPLIETTLATAPTASGGPLIDRWGRLVGIMVAPHPAFPGRNVAIPTAGLDNPRWLGK